MNNQELELKVKEILGNNNFFDMIEATVAFEKEYKGTEFYKKTKMPLMEVIKNAKMWYLSQMENIGDRIQKMINDLDFTKINNVLNQLGEVYEEENSDILNIINEFKDIVK